MKKQILLAVCFLGLVATSTAQSVTKTKWHVYTLGGKRNYFVKTHSFSSTKETIAQFGAGDQWDKQKQEIDVVSMETEGSSERVIVKYSDSSFYTYLFQNITPNQATVFTSDDEAKTIEEAKQYQPKPGDNGSTWLTTAGYTAAEKKKVMPALQKKDALDFMNYFVKTANEYKAKMEDLSKTAMSDDEKAGAGMGMAILLSSLPMQYAETKGFHPYKSMNVIEAGLKKFQNDKDVKKIMSQFSMK